jgi:hypothetical protein
MNEISGMDHSQSSTADSKGQLNYGDVVIFCDEAKGYADQSAREPGESATLPVWPFRVMKSADR